MLNIFITDLFTIDFEGGILISERIQPDFF